MFSQFCSVSVWESYPVEIHLFNRCFIVCCAGDTAASSVHSAPPSQTSHPREEDSCKRDGSGRWQIGALLESDLRRHLAMSGDIFGYHAGEGMRLTPTEQRPAQHPATYGNPLPTTQTKNYWAFNVRRAQVEKLCSRSPWKPQGQGVTFGPMRR